MEGAIRYVGISKQVPHPVRDGLWELGSEPFVYLAQLGQAEHVQVMHRERLGDVSLQGSLLCSPIFTSNLLQLNSNVVEAHCQLRRVGCQ